MRTEIKCLAYKCFILNFMRFQLPLFHCSWAPRSDVLMSSTAVFCTASASSPHYSGRHSRIQNPRCFRGDKQAPYRAHHADNQATWNGNVCDFTLRLLARAKDNIRKSDEQTQKIAVWISLRHAATSLVVMGKRLVR
ncbi:MAG: hypothetical protein BJ554DRAFT_4435 [Olpidium bornovanus]|uniref:Uncharacterized protein n=1 Tax=Olpidium bornovanus TaxID=278681 RepID=A0A8H7ZN16_9FUNG|nr:MAG: hypothetical protein BJ554DRAFT_4435 [Olpidium bornovanus]